MNATTQELYERLYKVSPTLVKTRDFEDTDVATNRLIFSFWCWSIVTSFLSRRHKRSFIEIDRHLIRKCERSESLSFSSQQC